MAGDGRIRLFCALQLPGDALDRLVEWQARELPGVAGRVVPREHLHVTLAFLGHRPERELPGILEALRAASAVAPSRIELRPVRYRETRSVGMIVLDDPTGAATALAGDVQSRLEALGAYRRERRGWLPHVTVLRFRAPAGLHPEAANMCSIHVVRSALYRSSLGHGGARYDALETAPLGGR
ncbi:MAG TPA: RNA 2',3'-cyclic phosphodiesterase [Gaiellaceae bacterium]|nr:RNA 2',3'-cyclic phosphodiesterase [Gaiellaceae bacterium]